jgi:TP901-1 family phage major tail protein
MSVQAGKDILLKIGDGGAPEGFTTVAGLRARTIALNARTVDVTDGAAPAAGVNCWRAPACARRR